MFKIAKLTVPISISRLFKLNSDVHNYNTRQVHHIHSFKGNNEFIYRTFKFVFFFCFFYKEEFIKQKFYKKKNKQNYYKNKINYNIHYLHLS